MPDERESGAPHVLGEKRASPFLLTNTVIYLHAVYFLIPWRRVPYFPNDLVSPYKVYALLFVLLCAAWAIEAIRFGVRRSPLAFGVVVLWFWAIFWVGLLYAYMTGDVLKTSVPLYMILWDVVPYVDGMLVWYLIYSNMWGWEEFESALKSVLGVTLVLGVESILVFYLGIPNTYSVDSRTGMFISMFTSHHVVPARLALLLVGVGFYFFLRRGGYFYIFASLSGMLMLFATGKRSPVLGLFLGILLLFIFFLRFRKHLFRKKKITSFYTFFVGPLIFVLLVSVGLTAGTAARPEFVDVPNLIRGLKSRNFEYARAIDIFIERPFLGGGPRRGFFYGYSADTPSTFSSHIYGDITQYNLNSGWASMDLFQKNPLETRLRTLHSFPLNVIVDLGILGVIWVLLPLLTVRYFIRVMLLRPHENSLPLFMPFAVIFCTIPALFIAVSTSAKFYPIWLFAILLHFVRYIYREITMASVRADSG